MDSVSVVEVLIGLVITLMGGWLLRLEKRGNDNMAEAQRVRDRVFDLEKDLAKNYHSKGELREVVQDAMRPVHIELERLSRAVERFTASE